MLWPLHPGAAIPSFLLSWVYQVTLVPRATPPGLQPQEAAWPGSMRSLNGQVLSRVRKGGGSGSRGLPGVLRTSRPELPGRLPPGLCPAACVGLLGKAGGGAELQGSECECVLGAGRARMPSHVHLWDQLGLLSKRKSSV